MPPDAATTADLAAASRLRYTVTQRLDQLDHYAAHLGEALASTAAERDALGERLEDAEVTWAKVISNLRAYDGEDVDRACELVGALRAQDAILDERADGLRARLGDVDVEKEVLRSVHRCAEELLSENGAGPRPGPARARNTSRQIFQIIEEERMRIARDMHDGPAQSMANLVLQAEILEKLYQRTPDRLIGELSDFKAGVRGVLDDTRRLIFDLRPMTLDDLGLVPTLRKFLPDYGEKTGIATHLNVVGEDTRLPGNLEPTLFRIIQEALTNARKHSRAKNVTVSIIFEPGRVTASVKDDGAGFDVTATEARLDSNRNLGLISMRERSDLEKGQMQIRSQLGQGTEVRATFDL